MNKTKFIIKREYISRVKKKSFILMTIIGPLLFAGLIAAPVWLASLEDSEVKRIAVVDSSGVFDYTKVLQESITLNSQRYYSELQKEVADMPKIGSQIKAMNEKLHMIAYNRDTMLGENLRLGFIEDAKKIKNQINGDQEKYKELTKKYSELLPLVVNRLKEKSGKIKNTSTATFKYTDLDTRATKLALKNEDYYAVIYIPSNVLSSLTIQIKSAKSLSMGLRSHIQNSIERAIENQKLLEAGIDQETLENMETDIIVQNTKVTDEGEEEQARPELAMIIGYAAGFLIYISIFMFGAQVMRGVIEEKTSRIVEVILSSVKPRELLMGKVFGVGLVGLTQYFIWIVMTAALSFAAFSFLLPSDASTLQSQAQDLMQSTGGVQTAMPVVEGNMGQVNEIMTSLANVNWPLVLGTFIFFFLGGYMLYAALFAAVGSAVDNEADTQQFMAPITIPLILGLFVMLNTINNPEGDLAYWFSIIPFTSPIVMIVRIPFGVPVIDLVISGVILIATFLFITWMAARIYKTGILMFGSKVTYKELWKWIKIRD